MFLMLFYLCFILHIFLNVFSHAKKTGPPTETHAEKTSPPTAAHSEKMGPPTETHAEKTGPPTETHAELVFYFKNFS